MGNAENFFNSFFSHWWNSFLLVDDWTLFGNRVKYQVFSLICSFLSRIKGESLPMMETVPFRRHINPDLYDLIDLWPFPREGVKRGLVKLCIRSLIKAYINPLRNLTCKVPSHNPSPYCYPHWTYNKTEELKFVFCFFIIFTKISAMT